MNTTSLLLTLVLVPVTAFGQSDFGDYQPSGPFHQPVPPLPPELAFSYHHASTPAEGWLRGWAQVIHATGNYLLSRSQSAIVAEQARALDLSNDRRLIENHDWKQARRDRELEAKRLKNKAARPEKYRLAYELSSDQLERVSGEIAWPEVLRTDRYEGSRRRLEELFRKQAGYDGPQTNCSPEIERESQSLIRDFDRNRSEVPQTEYLATQKFLRGLKHEPMFRTQVN